MRIGFVVNELQTEEPGYTTTRMSMAALNLGHEAWVMGVGDFDYAPDERIHARGRMAPKRRYKSLETYLADLQGPKASVERITVNDLDVLLLRNDPSGDTGQRSWAQAAGIIFGRAAMRRGVIVLNDPDGLARAQNKMYFQDFPEAVRPATLITREREEIRAFAREQGGNIVLKPLQGSGGANVFLVRPDDLANLNQMIDAVSRDGYVIAQEYLPAASQGDMRLFIMNGQPLRYKGKYCAFRRERRGDDMRSNVHDRQGGGRRDRPQARGDGAPQARDGRDVLGGPRHRRGQADGDQRLLARGAGQRPEAGGCALHAGRDRGDGAEGPVRELLSAQLQQRGDGHPVAEAWRRPAGSARLGGAAHRGHLHHAAALGADE
ncbi:MAG: ATP-grasp domain-containing protein, partial [Planctomycetota bacterium]